MKRHIFSGELRQMVKEIGLTTLSILAPLGTLSGFWIWLGYKGVAIVLVFFLAVTFYWAYRRRTKAVPYNLEDEEIMEEATKMLKSTKDSFYYYGGAGFIGKQTKWREAYQEKLLTDKVKIYRFLDAKPATEMKNMLNKIEMSEDYTKEAIDDYVTWLNTHSENLQKREKANFFYDFRGAPIWKYGIHCMIFDKKHVIIPFLSSAQTRSAVVIRDCPKMAETIVGSLDFLKETFFKNEEDGRRVLTSDDLYELAKLP